MSGHVGHHLRLTALRTRIRPQPGKYLHHELTPFTRLQLPSQRRNFSAADGINGLLRCSEWLITNTHEFTGAPWSVSIPLTALIVSFTIRTPLTLYAHQKARKTAKLWPLLQAQASMIALGLRKKAVPNLRTKLVELTKKRSKRLVRVFAGSEQASIFGGLATLPLFLSNLEVIRRMCGGPTGMLGYLSAALRSEEPMDAATVTTVTTSPNSVSDSATSTTNLAQTTASSDMDVSSSALFEPSLATEGCLWFPDLLQPDPLHILPFAVSAILIAHIMPETSAARRELAGLSPVAGDKHAILMGQTKSRRALQRTLLLLSFAVGPLTMNFPAALHLYWMFSGGFSLALTKGLKWAFPIPKNTIKPCQGMEIPLLQPKKK